MTDRRCTLVEISQDLPGYHGFIGSWVYRGGLTFLVDVGPANSADHLLHKLQAMGIRHVDYVLLTHIHLDHAGAVGPVLQRFPMAQAVCHEKGVAHLVDPARLWEGSLKVLKERAEAFGRPDGVNRDRVIAHCEFWNTDIAVVETPGHAAHHLSYSYGGYLFSGEAAGNFYNIEGNEFLRPATPPRLFLETFLKSVEKLRDLEDQRICYGHFGEAASSKEMLHRFQNQIQRWEETIRREAGEETETLVSRCVEILLRDDPELKSFSRMEKAVQQRERYFMANSVRGFLGFLKEENKH